MKKLLLLSTMLLLLESVNAKNTKFNSIDSLGSSYPSANAHKFWNQVASSNAFVTYNQLNDTIKTTLNCAPVNYNPKILSGANSELIHPDWIESEVGTSWSFLSSKKIINKLGVFLYGNLISPRGGVITKGCYIIYSEWGCSK